jgi:hypothetical protein
MKKWILMLTALIAASAFSVDSADAKWRSKKVGKGVVVASAVTGAAATASYFWINNWKWKWHTRAAGISQGGAIAATTIGCMAVAPMLATLFENRELTMREGHVLFASCLIPIVGGYIENAIWDANPEWEKYNKPVRVRR